MRLKQDQQDQVKVTISKYPFVKGQKNQSKSFTLYETTPLEVYDFFVEALESAIDDDEEEEGGEEE